MVLRNKMPHIGEFTKIPINLLFMVGICVHRWRANEKRRELQLFFVAVVIFHIGFDITAILLYPVYDSLETSLEISAYIIFATYAVNSLTKLICCILNNKKMCQGLRNLEKYYPKTRQEYIDYKLNENLKRLRKYISFLMISHFGVNGMCNIFPLLQSIVFYYQSQGQVFPYLLPYPMVYPFDYRKPLGYAVAYATQCSGSFLASCVFLGADLLLITCVHMINMNFRYLAKIIREHKPTGRIKDMEKLKSFIRYHNDILDTVGLIDDSFSVSSLLNYAATVIMICLIGIQIVAGTNLLDLVKFLSFLVTALIHVFFISIFGTEMMTLSCDISNALIHHAWYDGHIKYQRALILLVARAQRPAYLNAFKFFIISMESFKSLISVSYQFFTLIKTRYDEN